MTTDKLNEMVKRWEADMAALTPAEGEPDRHGFSRSGLSIAIEDLLGEIADLNETRAAA